MLSSMKTTLNHKTRVRFKLLLSWKLWRHSKHKACHCQGVVCLCFSLTKPFFRKEPCTPHHAMAALATAPVVIKTVFGEGQDVAVTQTFDCVFLNINK